MSDVTAQARFNGEAWDAAQERIDLLEANLREEDAKYLACYAELTRVQAKIDQVRNWLVGVSGFASDTAFHKAYVDLADILGPAEE